MLEIVFLFGGIYLYMKATGPITRGGRHEIFGLAMLPVQGIVFFGSPPASDRSAAITALQAQPTGWKENPLRWVSFRGLRMKALPSRTFRPPALGPRYPEEMMKALRR